MKIEIDLDNVTDIVVESILYAFEGMELSPNPTKKINEEEFRGRVTSSLTATPVSVIEAGIAKNFTMQLMDKVFGVGDEE